MKINLGGKTGSRPAKGAGFRTEEPGKGSRVFLFLFGTPFFAMGLLFCWLGAIDPILKVVTSGDWPQVPCTITKSEVERKSSSDGTTYSIDIRFSYEYGGRTYTDGRYGFNKVRSSGQKSKREVVRQYPLGSDAVCWVNPDDPEQAVLTRKIPGIAFFIIPFTSIFMIVGLSLMLGALGLLPEKWKTRVHSRHRPVDTAEGGASELKPDSRGLSKLLVALAVALFWNGIVSVFVIEVVGGHRKGDPDWFLTIFMIPFVVIGAGMIVAVFYFLLALKNPKITLHLSESRPRLGESFRLEWRSNRPLKRLRSLEIILEGKEEATYTRGTRSVTDTSRFFRQELFTTDTPAAQNAGELFIEIPAALMHSFDGGNNEITWSLLVEGDIPRWPDLSQSHPLTVRPLES